MTTVEAEQPPTHDAPSRHTKPLIAAVAAVVFLLASGIWWFHGGEFVSATGGVTVGMTGEVGEQFSIGVIVRADGEGATLRNATAHAPSELNVTWSVYQGKNGNGFGTAKGPLEPTWPVEPMPGHRISPNLEDTTFLIATVTGTKPGVYRLSGITVDYQSGWRHRSVDGTYVACFLVLAPGQTSEQLELANGPLWQQFQACDSAAVS
jgi:hypothetical protein